MKRRIYQYVDPKDKGVDSQVKWIAAEKEEHADNYAFMKAWTPRHTWRSNAALFLAGVDVILPKGGLQFENYYMHDKCATAWTDTWSCACNDKCPKCGAEIEPHASNVVSLEDPL